MALDSWKCLKFEDGNQRIISKPKVLASMMVGACELEFQKLRDRKCVFLVTEACTISVSTKWEEVDCGGRAGFAFRAHIERKGKGHHLTFALSRDDLLTGVEILKKLGDADCRRQEGQSFWYDASVLLKFYNPKTP